MAFISSCGKQFIEDAIAGKIKPASKKILFMGSGLNGYDEWEYHF